MPTSGWLRRWALSLGTIAATLIVLASFFLLPTVLNRIVIDVEVDKEDLDGNEEDGNEEDGATGQRGSLALRGSFGDQFGCLTCLFSGLSFVALVVTLQLQRQELQLLRQDLQEQRKTVLLDNMWQLSATWEASNAFHGSGHDPDPEIWPQVSEETSRSLFKVLHVLHRVAKLVAMNAFDADTAAGIQEVIPLRSWCKNTFRPLLQFQNMGVQLRRTGAELKTMLEECCRVTGT